MGVKERRTKILLELVLLSDVNLTQVTFNSSLQKVFDLTFNQKTRGTISGMMREGLIEKARIEQKYQRVGKSEISEKSESALSEFSDQSEAPISPISSDLSDLSEMTNSYRLTKQGFYALCLKFPFFRFLRDSWDLKWRVLSYEIPERRRELRDRLRREVSGWGLGPWHRSFWLTPHPIIENLRELVYQKEEEQYIQAFESEHVVGNSDILIEKVWQKSSLDNKYRDLFKIWHDILSNETDNLEKFKNVVNEYVEILKSDPGLPPELIGKNWIGFEAYNIFKEIRSILLS
ncbi:hypothetical protein HY612_00485 [Candidatus Roizmanbacteria bacterium]|nr:hypothetical protein [Candidatus Roizmanbacteria bacterium]